MDIIIRMAKERGGDDEARLFGKEAAKKFGSGTFKASQTGAMQLAKKRKDFSDMGQMAKSLTGGTKETEEYIRSGQYKKGGK